MSKNLEFFRNAIRSLGNFIKKNNFDLYLNLTQLVPYPNITTLVCRFLQRKEQPLIVKIGANDGKGGEPLYWLIQGKDCNVVFVEPVKFLFQRLKVNYGDSPKYMFENVAIGESREQKIFFYLSEDTKEILTKNYPSYYIKIYDQLGSFDQNGSFNNMG